MAKTSARQRASKNQSGQDGAVLDQLVQELVDAGAPPEVLEFFAGGNPADLLKGLLDEGLLVPTADPLDELLDQWQPMLRRGCTPFLAELAGGEFLGLMGAQADSEESVVALLGGLIDQAEQRATPQALAMLRVFAVAAPAGVRARAGQAADRLVASAGLTDQPWVKGLGAPTVGECFGYGDDSQETVTITFRYGRKRHAIAVLIDHALGGGVKDPWPTGDPDRVRAKCEGFCQSGGLQFMEYEPAEAHEILARALSVEPCPVELDQIEDVDNYLDLLRRRVDLLVAPAAGKTAAAKSAGKSAAAPATVHKVKVTLRGSRPPIWRRLEVPSGFSLSELNETIQRAFGWEDAHMWAFDTERGSFGDRFDSELGIRSARRAKLAAAAAGERMRYTYDFGDGWEHDIVVEAVSPAEPGLAYPRCLTGRRAGPPEDSGGICGYAHLLEVLADPSQDEHQDQLDWLGLASAADFDPDAFDRAGVNRSLAGQATVLVRA